jgi:hypothetical protein
MGGNVGLRLEANEANVSENVDICYANRQTKKSAGYPRTVDLLNEQGSQIGS